MSKNTFKDLDHEISYEEVETDTLSQTSISALNAVVDALDEGAIDPETGKIVWKDGEHLTILETVQKIGQESNDIDLNVLLEHVVNWLTMTFLFGEASKEQINSFWEHSGMKRESCDE